MYGQTIFGEEKALLYNALTPLQMVMLHTFVIAPIGNEENVLGRKTSICVIIIGKVAHV